MNYRTPFIEELTDGFECEVLCEKRWLPIKFKTKGVKLSEALQAVTSGLEELRTSQPPSKEILEKINQLQNPRHEHYY